MSGAGTCPRALSAEMLSYEAEPLPDFVERAAEEGRWHEMRIKTELDSQNTLVEQEQREFTLEYSNFNLVGHVDGICIDQPQKKNADGIWRLLEIKTMSLFEFERWMKDRFNAFPQYADQLTCYLEATGLKEALYIVKNRSSGYVDKQVLTEPPSDINKIVQRLDQVVKCVENNELAQAEFQSRSVECKRCVYKKLCLPEVGTLAPIQEAELIDAATDWKEGKKLTNQGEQLIENAKAVFKEHIASLPEKKFRIAGLSIIEYSVHKESYSKKILQEYCPADILNLALEVNDYQQMRIDNLEKEE
jgi:hypothetical protein